MDVVTYRIGFWTHKWWGHKNLWRGLLFGKDPHNRSASRFYYVKTILRRVKLLRRPHRPWQGEIENTLWCARAWTKNGAERKMLRWYWNGHDIKKHEKRYGARPDLWSQRIHELSMLGLL